jgi:hypothetical protein
LGVPQIGGIGLGTQQRLIGAATAEARVVANRGVFLMPENGNYGAVEVEQQAGAVLR